MSADWYGTMANAQIERLEAERDRLRAVIDYAQGLVAQTLAERDAARAVLREIEGECERERRALEGGPFDERPILRNRITTLARTALHPKGERER